MNYSIFTNKIEEHFIKNGWIAEKCCKCGRLFYSKKSEHICNSIDCLGEYSFLKFSKRNTIRFDREIYGIAKKYFQQKNIQKVNRNNIINKIGNTLFVVAGVQYFDKIIYDEEEFDNNIYFIPQPCIRLNSLGECGRREGISSSFLNICTGQVKGGMNDFINHIEIWLECFSKLGLFAGDISIAVEEKVIEWNNSMKALMIEFNYGGLELGEGCFIYEIKQNTRPNLNIIDFGFGFERIMWATNKNKSYFSLIGPMIEVLRHKYKKMDALKTVTLMLMSGVHPSNNNQGYQLKKLINLVKYDIIIEDIVTPLKYYYDYWNLFIQPELGYQACFDILIREKEYLVNKFMINELNIDKKIDNKKLYMGTEDLLEHMVKHYKVNIDKE